MTATETFQNGSSFEAQAVAHAVNSAVAAGCAVTVNGSEVWSRFHGAPATVWQNGSLSFDVRGRTPSAQGTVWVKRGQTATVTITEKEVAR